MPSLFLLLLIDHRSNNLKKCPLVKLLKLVLGSYSSDYHSADCAGAVCKLVRVILAICSSAIAVRLSTGATVPVSVAV